MQTDYRDVLEVVKFDLIEDTVDGICLCIPPLIWATATKISIV